MELHRGLDLRAPRGTPVLAIADAVIIGKWTETHGGNVIALAGRRPDGGWPSPRAWFAQSMSTEGSAGEDDSGFRYTYAHLDSYAPNANVGAVVKRGDVIALSGNSGVDEDGKPYADHLHLQVEWVEDGWLDTRVFIDPVLLLGDTIARRRPVHLLPPGQYVAPQGAIIQPRGAPAAQAKRESVIINVDGSGHTSINMGNGAALSGSLQVLPEGVF